MRSKGGILRGSGAIYSTHLLLRRHWWRLIRFSLRVFILALALQLGFSNYNLRVEALFFVVLVVYLAHLGSFAILVIHTFSLLAGSSGLLARLRLAIQLLLHLLRKELLVQFELLLLRQLVF